VTVGHSKLIFDSFIKHLKITEEQKLEDSTIEWAISKRSLYEDLQKDGFIKPLGDKVINSPIEFENFLDFIKVRRSNRFYLEKPISKEILNKLAITVNWASSSCNKQPIRLYTTINPDLAKTCLMHCKGGTGFGAFIPAFICFCADMRGYYLPDELYLPMIDVSLGAQNFFLAASTFDLSGTILSWALKDTNDENELRKLLSIPPYMQIVFNAVIGYPQKNYITPARKSLDQTISFKD
jgi:nitroreductase